MDYGDPFGHLVGAWSCLDIFSGFRKAFVVRSFPLVTSRPSLPKLMIKCALHFQKFWKLVCERRQMDTPKNWRQGTLTMDLFSGPIKSSVNFGFNDRSMAYCGWVRYFTPESFNLISGCFGSLPSTFIWTLSEWYQLDNDPRSHVADN